MVTGNGADFGINISVFVVIEPYVGWKEFVVSMAGFLLITASEEMLGAKLWVEIIG